MVRETVGAEASVCTTDSGSHHLVASELLDLGLHTLCEKPLALTIHGCGRVIAAAERSGKVLSVAENFRRDPMNRLVRALLDDAAIAQHLGDTAGPNRRRRRAVRGARFRRPGAGDHSGLDYRRCGARCRRATPHPHALRRPPAGALRAIQQPAAAGLRCGRASQEYGATTRISGSRRRAAASRRAPHIQHHLWR